jgi:hypothetical protein
MGSDNDAAKRRGPLRERLRRAAHDHFQHVLPNLKSVLLEFWLNLILATAKSMMAIFSATAFTERD